MKHLISISILLMLSLAAQAQDITEKHLRHEGTWTYHDLDLGSTFLRLPNGQWYELRSAKWEVSRTNAVTSFESATFSVEGGVYSISIKMEGSDFDIDRGHIFALFPDRRDIIKLLDKLESQYRIAIVLSNGNRS